MSFSSNLIDFNGYQNDFTDLDAESPDGQLNVNESIENNWPDNQGNFDTSPILDNNVWGGFNIEHGSRTKLVSSEEDLISKSDCDSPEWNKNKKENNKEFMQNYMSEKWEEEFSINPNNHNISQDMDHLADGFASNEVITIGDYPYEDNNESSPESQSKTMADRWSSTDYNTVLRINSSTNKNHQQKNLENDSFDKFESCIYTKKKVSVGFKEENKCTSCNGKVYITERLVIDNMLLHRHCFKCTKCRRVLSIDNFAAHSGLLYCKPHFLEMFRQTGKYDEINRPNNDQFVSNFEMKNDTGHIIDENTHTDELPPPQITRNIVEKFRLLESTTGTESLLPRQSSGHANTKCYQLTNKQAKNDCVTDGSTGDVCGEMPMPGITKNLLSLWTNIETKKHNVHEKLPPANKNNSQTSNGLFKSIDVVRHDDCYEDTFPAPLTAKSIAAKFKGQSTMSEWNQSNSNINRISGDNRNGNQSHYMNRSVDVVSSLTPNADWLQFRISDPNQGSENHPIHRYDVVSSDSKSELDEFPEQGITRSLVGLFKSLEVKR